MKEFIEKLIGRLEEQQAEAENEMHRLRSGDYTLPCSYDITDIKEIASESFKESIEIVNELAEEYINCSTDISTNTSTTTAEAYNKGLEDAWELAKKIALNKNGLSNEEIKDIYGLTTFQVFKYLTPQEALAKLEAYEINVGDVIESIYSGRLGVITNIKDNGYYVLFMDGIAGQLAHDDIKKTDKHIDITSVLEQLKG